MKHYLSWQKIGISELSKPSVLTLLVANLVPLYGVLFLSWNVFTLLIVFWMENVVVGVFNVFKMVFATPGELAKWLTKIFLIPLFCFTFALSAFICVTKSA